MAQFVHLRVHTEYSLVDGVVRIETEKKDDGTLIREGLIDAVARMRMPALAVTDHANLFALVKFYKAAQAKGIKPLVGVDVLLREDADVDFHAALRVAPMHYSSSGVFDARRLDEAELVAQMCHGDFHHRLFVGCLQIHRVPS